MEFSNDIPQSQLPEQQPPKLLVDFSWRKFHALVTEEDKPSDPIYIVDFRTLRSPHLVIKSASDDKVIGTGTLKAISINPDYEIHGQPGKLKALKRFRTQYTHLSRAFSDDEASLMPMTWSSNCGFKTWDFICLDDQQNPVAKFAANAWSVKKVGKIEFMGPKAMSQAARDEIVVTGLTLFYCMVLRTNSILSLFGAIIARPGPLDNGAAPLGAKRISQDEKSDVTLTSKGDFGSNKTEVIA